MKLEICTGDPEGIISAIAGGADRVELCSGLSEGGLTPSISLIHFSSARIPTNVLIRPRSGDFVYTPKELQVMLEDIKFAKENGATGIVVGALSREGEIDVEACQKMLEAAGDMDSTFHRAFDVVNDPVKALEEIIGLGFKRILTSGQAENAVAGKKLIQDLVEKASGRIKIMAGAGINPHNLASLIKETGADEFHASARSSVKSKMKKGNSVSMGNADASDGSRFATDASIVKSLKEIILLSE